LQNNIFSGLFVGQNLVVLKQVDSTNTYLKNLLSNSTPIAEGTVIMAEDQYAGRGQQQNRWHAEPGKNLTCSLLLKPTFLNPARQFQLNKLVSLAVADAAQKASGQPISIKWPNDIYWGDKKLGGILIENTLQGGVIKNAVVGIGLNVNQDVFPPDAPNPASVKQILHADYDLNTLLSDICSNIEAGYLRLKAGNEAELNERYLARLYRLNQQHTFVAGDEVFEGTITGVTEDGLLKVATANGERIFNLKEIQFLQPNK